MGPSHTARHSKGLESGPLRLIGITLLTAVALFGGARSADAGSYVIHSCRLPNGLPAPTAGWHSRSEADAVASDTCLVGGSLSVGFRAGVQPNTQYSGPWGEWFFDAPPDTRISAYALYRFVRAHSKPGPPPEASEYTHYTDARVLQFERDFCNPAVCAQRGSNPGFPQDPGNLLQVDRVDVSRIGFVITCWRSDGGDGCPSWTEPRLVIYATEVTLSDVFPPAIVSVAGNLAGQIDGVRTVAVTGLDRGSGLYRVQLKVDGVGVTEQSFVAARSTCVKPFVDPIPCPLTHTAAVPLDTSQLSDGPHQVQAVLADGAGNETSSALYSISVDNAGAYCSYGHTAHLGARFGRNGKSRLRIRAGRRVAVTGTLRGGNRRVLKDATVRVFVREQNQPSYHLARVVRTSQRGKIRFVMRAGSSRTLRLSYCAPGGGAVRQLRMAVSASSEIATKKRRLRNGQSMQLFGRLRGTAVPPNGKLIEIQAFFRGRWRTVSTVRSNSRGYWSFRYRFDGTRGRVVYRFRAFLPPETGYPYEPGKSPEVHVVVIGP
jgi:hypothetical protein